MKRRHQRCSLSSRSNVSAAKVRNHINAGQLREQGRVIELQCVAGTVKGLGLVPHSLTVRTDGSHLRRIQPGGVKQLAHDVGVNPNQRVDMCHDLEPVL